MKETPSNDKYGLINGVKFRLNVLDALGGELSVKSEQNIRKSIKKGIIKLHKKEYDIHKLGNMIQKLIEIKKIQEGK